VSYADDHLKDYRIRLDLAEQIARIDKTQAELRKLLAEARKFNRDPWFILLGAIIAALAARLPEILHAFGH
jgi:hypothetical protein